MTAPQIVLIVVAVAAGLAWLVFWVRRGLRHGRAAASRAADRAGFLYTVRCEKCGNERQARYEEVTAHAMSKSRGVSTNAQVGPIGVGGTRYTSFSKKMRCPQCGRETWHQVLNYNGHDEQAWANTANGLGPVILNGAIGLVGMTAIVMAVMAAVLTTLH